MTDSPIQSTRDWTFDDETRTRVDAIFQQWATSATPGMALGIYREGELVHANGYGMSNLEHGIPVTPDSIFHIASISKQFTDTCIALLAAENALDIDEDVRLYVPEVPDFGQTITIRHLIHHVSGLRDQWSLLHLAGWREEDLVTEQDVLDLLQRQRALNFTPNDEYLYCNTGYTLLALIVKRVSGRSLRQFAQERIFGPLGMTSTHFHDDHSEIVSGRTQAYQPRKTGGYRISIPVFDVVGTTSLFTTVEDMAKWDGNFTSTQVGGQTLIDQIQTPGTFNDGKPMTYAWGLALGTYRSAARIGHSGADHGYRADYLRLPEFGFAVAVLANVSDANPGRLTEQVADVVLGDHLAPATTTTALPKASRRKDFPPIVSPAAVAGIYQITGDEPALFPYLVITSRDGQAWLDAWEPVALNSIGSGRFTVEGDWLTLGTSTLDDDGLVSSLSAILPHESDEPKTYTRVAPPTLDASALDAYTGDYWSEELATGCALVADRVGGTLILRQRKRDDQTLVPLVADTFGRGPHGMIITFERDADGTVTGFQLSGGRVRNLEFSRR